MDERVAATAPAIAYYIDRVNRKLATGAYPTESVACFCGESSGVPVRTKDRYGHDYRLCFCSRCGLLYASPRMTDAAMRAFYQQDYRAIYDWGLTDAQRREQARIALANGHEVRRLCLEQGLAPSVVFELGSNDGSMLEAFMEQGAACLGVDYDLHQVVQAQACGRPVRCGGLELLEQDGRKADLIVAHHVLEHVADLEGTLRRLRALLAPNGLLYVGLPSLFLLPLDKLVQNAHTYQFTARTLAYVMECCGFEDRLLTEDICSFWQASDTVRDKASVETQEVYGIAQLLQGKRRTLPTLRTVNKFPREMRKAHLLAAVASGRPSIQTLGQPNVGREAVILGGGPSIDQEVETVRALQRDGAVVYAIERMIPWCATHQIQPDYIVAMDAHEDVTEALQQPPENPTYLIAMQCHPKVWDCLKDRRVYLFSTPQKDIPQGELFDAQQVTQWTQVNAGGSVVICAMSLAMMLGSRHLHIFGFDCQFQEQVYASHIAGAGEVGDILEIEIAGYGDRVFRTTAPYLSFAQQFLELIELCRRKDYLVWAKVYGDALVKYLATPTPILPGIGEGS